MGKSNMKSGVIYEKWCDGVAFDVRRGPIGPYLCTIVLVEKPP